MVIGKTTVKNFKTDEIIFQSDIYDVSILGGRLYVSLGAEYQRDLKLIRNSIYKVNVKIEDKEELDFIANFEDYTFSSSASDYYDQEGVHHSGLVSTNNRLQFGIVTSV